MLSTRTGRRTKNDGHDDVESAPFINCTAPGKRDQARDDGTDEYEVADDVDASELLFPLNFALVADVQEYEEEDEGN
jgi:hypothetical protein